MGKAKFCLSLKPVESDSSKTKGSGVLKRGYSDREVYSIYELGRLFLENGQVRRAEVIFRGLIAAIPGFAPGWLGMCAVLIAKKEYEGAFEAAKRAYQTDSDLAVAELFYVTCLLSNNDYNAAGTTLGEMAEKIEIGRIQDPDLIRFFKIQLARYQTEIRS